MIAGGIFYMIGSENFMSLNQETVIQEAVPPPQKIKVAKAKTVFKKREVQKALANVPDFGAMYTLSGITSSDGQKLALINNQVFSTGSYVDGVAFLKEIATKHVILVIKGQEVRISL